MIFASKNRDGEHFQRVLIDFDSGSPAIDAFHRLRVSNPTTLFDSQLQFNNIPFLWECVTTGGGVDVHAGLTSSTLMSVGASASDSVIRQTRLYYRYQPGKSQYINMTTVLGIGRPGVVKRVGYFDEENGVFLEQDGSIINLVLRSNVTGTPLETRIAQKDWNGDRLDGSKNRFNVSGQILNVLRNQLIYFDLQWLSAGTVRVGFDIKGAIVYAHRFEHANVLTLPLMTTANLPIRYEITSDGQNEGSLRAICAAIESEGGFEEQFGFPFTATNATAGTSVAGDDLPILTIRPKLIFNSITNRAQIIHKSIAVLGTQPAVFKLVCGGILTNASFSSVDDESMAEFDTSATAISGGIALLSNPVERGGVFETKRDLHIPISLDIAGNHPTIPFTDNLTVVASKISATSMANVSLNWEEQR